LTTGESISLRRLETSRSLRPRRLAPLGADVDGDAVGNGVGDAVGKDVVGDTVGMAVGSFDGDAVGKDVVGDAVGNDVGALLGCLLTPSRYVSAACVSGFGNARTVLS
jgi:hypothetical protein